MLKEKKIIAKDGDRVLVKVTSKMTTPKRTWTGTRYEIWTSKEKFEQGTPDEYINGQQHIYRAGFNGFSESHMIEYFHLHGQRG